MAHTPGDIVQVSFRQLLSSQRVLNILHYRVVSGTSQASDIADNASLAIHIGDQIGPGLWLTVWAEQLCTEWTLQRVRVQKIAPTRSTFIDETIGQSGLLADAQRITNFGFTVTKRGQQGNRKAIGGMHLAGFPPTTSLQGFATAGVKTWWLNNGHFWSDSITVPINNIVYRPCIFNPGSIPNYQDISAWALQDTTRCYRRRTVGLGE